MKLKKINFNDHDELVDLINEENFFDTNSKDWPFSKIYLYEHSSDVKINDEIIEVNIDLNKYLETINLSRTKSEAAIKLSKMLWNDFTYVNSDNVKMPLPDNIMYSKEVWTYLNLTIFFELTKKWKFPDEKSLKDKGKIERNYFNTGGNSKIDRTGLRWLWVLARLTAIENDFSLTKIAWEYVDSFKALQERILGRNSDILKAYCIAITKLESKYLKKLKNYEARTIIPKHINNFACSIIMDAYTTLDDLSDLIAEQIRICLNKLVRN